MKPFTSTVSRNLPFLIGCGFIIDLVDGTSESQGKSLMIAYVPHPDLPRLDNNDHPTLRTYALAARQ